MPLCMGYHSSATFQKSFSPAVIGPVRDGTIEELNKHSNQSHVCKYTLNKDGKWYIRDLVHKSEMPFSYDNFWKNDIATEGIWYPEI